MIKASFVLLGLTLFLGCSSNNHPIKLPPNAEKLDYLHIYTSDTSPARKIYLERELSFGSTKKVLIGKIGEMTVNNTGQMFIVDSRKHVIDVFTSSGRYVTHLGRDGRGPGEFTSSPSLDVVSHKLYAYDGMMHRINVFATDSYDFNRIINLNQHRPKILSLYYIKRLYVRNDSTFLVCFAPLNTTPPTHLGQKKDRLYRLYYVVNSSGNITSGNIFKQKGHTFLTASIKGHIQEATNFPFLSKSLITVSKDGHIYSAWSKYFLIKVYNPNGKYQQSFYFEYDNLSLIKKRILKQSHSSYCKQIIRQNKLPPTWPALHDMKIDDQNRLWVSTIVPNQKVYQWWVLNADDGKLLSRFKWPRSKSIQKIQGNKLYTRETDSSGVGRIVRYGIQMN